MESENIYKKLIQNGLFPERLGDIFSSVKFGEWVMATKPQIPKDGDFHLVSFKSTRNDNAPRIFGIPNPIAHLNTSLLISTNWTSIEAIFARVENRENISMIIPKEDNINQRLVSLNSYDRNPYKEYLETKKQFGKKYFVHADIAGCYPSIYTHSITWALVGKTNAKKGKRKNNTWYNKIDQSFQNAQNKETKGIPIGPDTSAIVAEIILSRIDQKLSKKYEYNRYIDDYYCFCETREKAEHFIRDLSTELEIYKLSINTKKTRISPLPKALNESWVRKLKSAITWKQIGSQQKDAVISFLDLSNELFSENPGESSIRYAIQVIRKKKYVHFDTFQIIIQYFYNLCYLYPYVIDTCHLFIQVAIKSFPVRKEDILSDLSIFLNSFLKEHIDHRRTDAIVWGFYNAIIFDLDIQNIDSIVKKIKGDCLSNLSLYIYLKSQNKDTSYFNKYFLKIELDTTRQIGKGKKGDYSDMWLFCYEFSRIENKTLSIPLLEASRKQDISFLSEHILQKLGQ